MLTSAQITQYQTEGFLIFPRFLSAKKLGKYLPILEHIVDEGRTLTEPKPHWSLEVTEDRQPVAGQVHKVQGVCVVEPRLLDLAREEPLLGSITSLLGRNLDVFGTKFFPKLPPSGTSVGWHQDNYYFGTNQEKIVSCAIYMQDTDRANGCLRVIPKSHQSQNIRQHQPMTNGQSQHTKVDETKSIDVEVPAGTAIIFSPNLLHGTYKNCSPRSRYSVIWHYIPNDFSLTRFPKSGEGDRHAISRF
ncbi:hypothetical protein CMK15_02570 [Candidatus Poribacteria bacterium]|nr:hypothetical protein [Candidatus Poribacteria bacterium]MBP97714.1 hypothetical protein [Candidatus Poribacteria bacterium]|tara:strand:- start:107 stop:844 length:738 start_codon:yes stop_codon:yes gene_type:complete